MESISYLQLLEIFYNLLGYETKNVKVTGSTVNVTLAESGELLQDVVVLGSRSAPRTVTECAY
jgi:iron complex outermembrane receptor protein